MHCDFCYATEPKWCYPAEPISLPVLADDGSEVEVVKDSWAACDYCHALIENEEWAGLIGRSVRGFDRYFFRLRLPPLLLSGAVSAAHEGFRRSRRGEALRLITPQEPV